MSILPAERGELMDEGQSKWMTGIAAVLGLLLSVFIGLTFFTGIFRITEIEYDLNPNVKESDILRLTDIEKTKSIIFFKLTSGMQKDMMKHPYVKTVKVIKHLPNRLEFVMTYYEDYACFKYANMYIIVDENGKVLKVIDHAPGPKVPLIDGFAVTHFKTGEPLNARESEYVGKVLDLISLVKKSQIDSVQGFTLADEGVQMKLHGSLRCNFGKMFNVESQFNTFVAIYEDLKGKGVKAGMIDVGGTGLPTFRNIGN